MGAAIAAISKRLSQRLAAGSNALPDAARASLAYAQIAEIMIGGVHRYLDDVIKQCNSLHAAVHMVYIDYPIQSALELDVLRGAAFHSFSV